MPVRPRRLDQAAIGEIADGFHGRHRQTYGHDNRAEPVQIVSLRVTAIGAIPPLTIRQEPAAAGTDAVKSRRTVWFRATGPIEATVYDRARMPASLVATGPAVIESLESTALVPPGWQAMMNADGFVVMSRTGAGDAR